ncbi:MAG: dihydrofolate reductase family protein [Rhodobacteraceae bacterium]|nr:dihydrofolate reductase family protein [Paracoccaceae bacterium]
MAVIRGMMAASPDGFAADAAGGVGWLAPWEAVDWGLAAFLAGIGTVVMGRRTYDDIEGLGPDWPYPGKRPVVVSGRPLGRPRGGATVWGEGLAALAAWLRGLDDGDAWVVGGPRLQAAFLQAGALDRMELCIVPRLLGGGLPVLAGLGSVPRQPRLADVRRLPAGLVMLDYRF